MNFRELWLMSLKQRFASWLLSDVRWVAISTQAGNQVVIASYQNGRLMKELHEPPKIPDHVPDTWNENPPPGASGQNPAS